MHMLDISLHDLQLCFLHLDLQVSIELMSVLELEDKIKCKQFINYCVSFQCISNICDTNIADSIER